MPKVLVELPMPSEVFSIAATTVLALAYYLKGFIYGCTPDEKSIDCDPR